MGPRVGLFLLALQTLLPGCHAYTFADSTELQSAANAWFLDSAGTEVTYGAMSTWDVSGVTSLRGLFKGRAFFNEDISSWSVARISAEVRKAVSWPESSWRQLLSSSLIAGIARSAPGREYQ